MSVDLALLEKSLLTGKWDTQIPDSQDPAVSLAKAVVEGRFRDALTSQPARTFFRVSQDIENGSLSAVIDTNSSLSNQSGSDQEILRLTIAVACLHAFIQANWTGPGLDVTPAEILVTPSDASFPVSEERLNQKSITELAHGGEPAYHLIEVALLLRLAQILLGFPFARCKTALWWRLRSQLVHQQVLDEPVSIPSDTLGPFEELETLYASDPELLGRLHLEQGLLHHLLSQDKLAVEYFVRAGRSTGLEYELTGALGKRTKFQQTELSQLVLLAESHLSGDAPTNTTAESNIVQVPETLPLNDDTLLEQTQFTSSNPSQSGSRLHYLDPSSQPALHPLDQCILLGLCLNVKNTSPLHGLTTEQMSPYVARVISHPRNWTVHTMALLLRSRLESTRTRTVERSALQLQALVDQMPTADSTLSERLLLFHSVLLPSKWDMEKELAQRYISLGVVKSALEIFERLEMWEEVVRCWVTMERPEKGLTIIRDLLEGRKLESEAVTNRGKTASGDRRKALDATREAKLWCLLGDLEPERAVAHYEQTSGRAVRSLGGYYFARGEYEKAIAIHPLLSRSWFILGCSCMRVEDWEGAKNAFTRCVAIDEDDAESWNNLATMYLRIGTSSSEIAKSIPYENKMLAFRALQQGLKYSYDNWRMWSNYMVVAMDVGQMAEACRALGRVVEETVDRAGAKSVDEQVLERLVDAVTRAPAKLEDAVEGGDVPNATMNPNEGHGLLRNVLILFDRTILPRVSSSRIFNAYARLLTWQSRWEDALKAYLDGYRCGTAGTMEKGETEIDKWRDAVTEVEEIVDVLRNFGPRVDGFKWRLQARSLVRTFVGRSKDFEDELEWKRLCELLDELRKESEE
ncbi:hypothetical protein IW261DRAFT_1580856 [Armillaria novae-zelandiae]|uniref:TPR repeat-containing protein n=1 Tax=Armillaria novae-zelandiae TaxID=153914 RepID=A0AA39PW01_9AGAR|nr:hypothetical protein IW261DRAFT_1580856 [Armillaria novae-zelandiae]